MQPLPTTANVQLTEIQKVFLDRRAPIREADPAFDSEKQVSQMGAAQVHKNVRHMLT